MSDKWLIPSYYKQFKCKCDKCRHSCCHGWQIPLSKQEYIKLISMECDSNLRHCLDISFKEPEYITDERYKVISFNYLGDCPMQNKGLCNIHSELGENNLPSVCRLYPRSLKRVNEQNIACCSSSCEAVVELLLESDNLKLVYDELNEKPMLNYEINEDIISELKEFEEIMKDRSTSLKDSIQQICIKINEQMFINDFNCNLNPLNEGLWHIK